MPKARSALSLTHTHTRNVMLYIYETHFTYIYMQSHIYIARHATLIECRNIGAHDCEVQLAEATTRHPKRFAVA